MLVGTLASAHLAVHFESPSHILSILVRDGSTTDRFSGISIAVLGGGGHAACVAVGVAGSGTDKGGKSG